MLFGLEGGFDFHNRLTKPLALILPGVMELFTGLHPQYTFLFQNVLCFYLSGILMYKILEMVFRDGRKAYLGMLVYCMCQPFAIFSLFVLTDVIGWFFGILGIYLALKHLRTGVNPAIAFILGIFLGIGFLAKESAVIGLIFIASYLLLGHHSIREKAVLNMASILGFFIPIVISHFVIAYYFDDSIIKTIAHAHDSTRTDVFTFENIKQLYRVMDVYWFLFAVGFIVSIRALRKGEANIMDKGVMLAAVLSFTLINIWPYFLDRILFIMAPFLVIIIIHGIDYFKGYGLSLVLVGGVFNIFIAYLIYRYDFHGGILAAAIAYLGIMAVVILYLKKENRTRIE